MTELPDELRALGHALPLVDDDLADLVMARIATLEPPAVPARRWRRLRRWLAGLGALLLALVITAALAAPVRAAIGRAFGFGGVQIRPGAGPSPVPSPSLPGEHEVSLAEAAGVVGFPVRVPAALGAPDSVTVADGRVVTLRWTAASGGVVRLDEFAGGIGYFWDKYTAGGMAQAVTVAEHQGLWFAQPVTLVYVGADGRELPDTARETSATLLWTDGPLTLRLDGLRSLDAARAVATTLH